MTLLGASRDQVEVRQPSRDQTALLASLMGLSSIGGGGLFFS